MEHLNPKPFFRKQKFDLASLFNSLRNGDISSLSRAITLIESTNQNDLEQAGKLLQLALPYSGKSFRLGITGVPGVGKSTFIEALGQHSIRSGKKVAVLAIDPSSSITKGSILGDKTRMEELVKSDQAFIRPSPAGETLGGVARKTREAIILCEAAGFDFIIIETVGVGQSETAVHSMTDFFLLLKLAGAGDNLQGIKRGIMEMADTVVINKADGENLKAAKHARQEFKNALHILPSKQHKQEVKVMMCSGLNDDGVLEVFDLINEYHQHVQQSGYFNSKREQQDIYWLKNTIDDKLKALFYNQSAVADSYQVYVDKVISKEMTPYQAADQLINLYQRSI